MCRDFQRLAITFLRALNIPRALRDGYSVTSAYRYPSPMDFSAWLEAYVGGAWHTLERATTSRIGRILMARGRDAVDVALTTSFGAANLTRFVVWTEEVAPVQPPFDGTPLIVTMKLRPSLHREQRQGHEG